MGILITVLSAIGCVGTASIYLPQIIRVIKLKKASQISWLMSIFEMSSNVFWLIATGLQLGLDIGNLGMNIALTLVNSLCFMSALTLLILKYKWGHK